MFKSSGKVAIEKKHNEQNQPTWTKFSKNIGEVQVEKKA
jgi:phage terminase large subunit